MLPTSEQSFMKIWNTACKAEKSPDQTNILHCAQWYGLVKQEEWNSNKRTLCTIHRTLQSQHRQKQGLKHSLKKSDIEVIKLDWRMKPYMNLNLSSGRKGNILRGRSLTTIVI